MLEGEALKDMVEEFNRDFLEAATYHEQAGTGRVIPDSQEERALTDEGSPCRGRGTKKGKGKKKEKKAARKGTLASLDQVGKKGLNSSMHADQYKKVRTI